MSQGKIVIFSAPSGAGKTTIVRHLLAKNKCLTFSISATTRSKRPNEVDGKDYYFLSKETFIEKIKQNAFAEYEQVYEGLFYGTLKEEVNRIWNEGKHIIVDVDVKGGLNLKKQYGDQALAVFVKPPDIQTLETRLRNRNTESEDKLLERIAKASEELQFEKQFDVALVNDNIETAFKDAEALVDKFISG
ncbi:guanylate kinase [Chondrinema litorale]|uniref:guanylate kinase n=1 Tax=Chondrinema litorale TaxID=2994555 RepID=UPI002543DA10|nr:guanylate kinase [Chondrinema litorale]UZR96060.1 guanylate kinase [Chondrinema litorale]